MALEDTITDAIDNNAAIVRNKMLPLHVDCVDCQVRLAMRDDFVTDTAIYVVVAHYLLSDLIVNTSITVAAKIKTHTPSSCSRQNGYSG